MAVIMLYMSFIQILFFSFVVGKCVKDMNLSPWGNVYFENGIEEVEFISSSTSSQFACDSKPFIISDEISGCKDIKSGVKDSVVVFHANISCTLKDQIKSVVKANASAAVIVNNRNILANFVVEDIYFPVIMVKKRAGALLHKFSDLKTKLKLLNFNSLYIQTNGVISCQVFNASTFVTEKCGCKTKLTSLKGGIAIISSQGQTELSLSMMEFYTADSGSLLPLDIPINLVFPNNLTAFGCTTVTLSQKVELPFVLALRRGTCTFALKLLNAYAAGAIAVVFINEERKPLISPMIKLSPDFKNISKASLLPSMIVRASALTKFYYLNDHLKLSLSITFQKRNISIEGLHKHAELFEVNNWSSDYNLRELQLVNRTKGMMEYCLGNGIYDSTLAERIEDVTEAFKSADNHYLTIEADSFLSQKGILQE